MMDRTGRGLLTLFLLTAVPLVSSPPAFASRSGAGSDLLLDVPGDGLGFADGPFSLVTRSGLSPGQSDSVVVGARNDDGPSSDLTLKALEIEDLDTGCSPNEASVDATCGAGPGELGDDIRLEISADLDRNGDSNEFGTPLFTGTLRDLAGGVVLGEEMSSGDEWSFRITTELPAASGNETMTDSLVFDLEWSLAGDIEVVLGDPPPVSKTGIDLLGEHLVAPSDPAVDGADGAVANTPAPPARGLLPFTGLGSLRHMTVGALALLFIGTAIRVKRLRRPSRRKA
jgi:hypothetical protein